MWPEFDFRTRCHMWMEFVGSLLCYERFSPGYSTLLWEVFPRVLLFSPLIQKPTFDLIWFVNNDCKNNDLGNADLISSRIVKRVWKLNCWICAIEINGIIIITQMANLLLIKPLIQQQVFLQSMWRLYILINMVFSRTWVVSTLFHDRIDCIREATINCLQTIA